MKGKSENGNYQKIEPKSSISILADSSYQFIIECFSPFTPSFLQNKTRSCKANHSQVFKHFERCEYKTTCRPPVQLFKANQDYKVFKKIEETSVQSQRKLLKTNKTTNKIFQHNTTDSESLKIYRDLYIYKSIGSVARKNLERAIAVYNANREEIEMTRKLSSRKNSNSYKREEPNHKKPIKNEMNLRTNKTKSDKVKIKNFKYSLQEINSSQSKKLQLLDGGTTVCNSMEKLIKKQFPDGVNFNPGKTETFNELEKCSKVTENQIKKVVIKNGGVKRILPKLQVKPIERKIKEKKQLALAVLNISLPLLNEKKEGTLHDLRSKIKKHKMQNIIYEDNCCKTYFNLDGTDEELSPVSNRKKIVNDKRGKLYSPSKGKPSKRRGYLLKLPITDMKEKGLHISSPNYLNLLTFEEPEITFPFSSPLNNDLTKLPKHVSKENYKKIKHTTTEHSKLIPKKSTSSNSWNIKKETGFFDPYFFEKEKKIGTSEFNYSFSMNDEQESKNKYSNLRQILINSQKNGSGLYSENGLKMTAYEDKYNKIQNRLSLPAENINE